MRHAASSTDPVPIPYPISEWLLRMHAGDPVCPICREKLHEVAARDQKSDPHYSHYPNSACPTIVDSSKRFEIFSDIERESASEEVRAVRQYTLDNIESIYYRAQSICPQLSWKEFLDLLVEANNLNVWSVKSLNPGYIPYLLLCCAKTFPAIKGSNSRRPHEIFFVLEPSAGNAEFWHRPTSTRQRIWRVVKSTGIVDPIQIEYEEVVPWYRIRAKDHLKL